MHIEHPAEPSAVEQSIVEASLSRHGTAQKPAPTEDLLHTINWEQFKITTEGEKIRDRINRKLRKEQS